MKNLLKVTTAFCAIALFSLLAVIYAAAAPDLTQEKFDIEDAGILTGRVVLADGTPFTTGFVAFFKSNSESSEHQDYGMSKRSPLMVGFFKKDGKFVTNLFPAGSYFMGVVEADKWVGGPPKKDQKKYSAIDKDGNYLLFEVKAAETVDIGTVTIRKPVDFPKRKAKFTVSGRVLDALGQGVADSVVVAKIDINEPKGVYISAETDAEGNYELMVVPGKFFFVARKALTMAGRPKPGGLMGTLGHTRPIGIGGKSDQPPAYIIGKDGESFKDVNITMFEVPVPDIRRKEIEAQVKSKQIDKSTLPQDLPLMKQRADDAIPSQHKSE